MDVAAHFFTKLRVLAINLEKEIEYLDHALNHEDDHEETAPKKILHELHSEVRNIKADLHKKIETLETEHSENDVLLRAFQILHQKNSADLEEIEEHFQNYGYESLHKKDEEPQMKSMETETEVAENAGSEAEPQDEEVNTPQCEKPSLTDHLRTPQLGDFGLGHLMFQSVCGVPECTLPSDPKMAQEFPGNYDVHSSICQDPVWPKTPKCTLQLGDEMLLTPKMESFEIGEHTGCVNDFTMALYNKRDQLKNNSGNPSSTAEDFPPKASSSEQIVRDGFVPCMSMPDDMLNSPLPPVFCTPGLKVHQDNSKVSMDEVRRSNGSIPSPALPNFETPWLKKQSTSQILRKEGTKAFMQKASEEPQLLSMNSENYFLNGDTISPTPLPMMTNYEILFDTPKIPEMTTTIPSDVLEIISSYDVNLKTPYGHKSSKENFIHSMQ